MLADFLSSMRIPLSNYSKSKEEIVKSTNYELSLAMTGKWNIREINPPLVSCFRSIDSRAIDSL
jgi:hypothetical protein